MTAKRLGAKQPSCYSFTDFLRSIVQPSNLSFSFLSNFGGARRRSRWWQGLVVWQRMAGNSQDSSCLYQQIHLICFHFEPRFFFVQHFRNEARPRKQAAASVASPNHLRFRCNSSSLPLSLLLLREGRKVEAAVERRGNGRPAAAAVFVGGLQGLP